MATAVKQATETQYGYRVGGGTSVNSIPFEAWIEVDLRSASAAELAKLDAAFLAIVGQAVASENAARSTAQGEIVAEMLAH